MKLISISDYIFRELSSPTDISISSINLWIRGRLGDLNLKIGTSYSLDNYGEITPEVGDKELAILNALYKSYYYDKAIRANLGAASIDTVLEASSDGGVIRLQNKNSVAQSYIQAKKIAVEELNGLIDSYALDGFRPVQTCGSDTESPFAYNLDDRQR